MLSTEDLQAIKGLFEETVVVRLDQLDGRMERMEGRMERMEGRMEQLEGRMEQLEGRVDQLNDRMEHLEGRMEQLEGRVDQLNDRMEHLEGCVNQLNGRMEHLEGRVDRLDRLERFFMEELERVRSILEKRIDALEEKVSEIAEYYRIRRLEDDNTAILLKLHDELEKRVARLEKMAC